MTETLEINDLTIEVRRSSRRRNVDLTVDRDGSVVVAVPERLTSGEIEGVVRSRLVSLYSNLGRKRDVLSQQPPKEFVTGEGFFYFGRKYRLKLIDSNASRPLALTNGRFLLSRECTGHGRQHFLRWYTEHGQHWIADKVASLQSRVPASPAAVKVRDLGYRWGSCADGGTVYFNWRCILLPAKRIEYLILHELCHLHEHNHGSEFYERLQRATPDYLEHEQWLRENGDQYDI